MPINRHAAASHKTVRQSGMSLTELLVGVSIGLMIALSAIALFVNNLSNTRRLTAETRVNLEMRNAADLVSRDLRRAGYWKNAISGTIADNASMVTAENLHVPIDREGNSKITYNFDQAEDDALSVPDQFGFELVDGIIRMRTDGDTWQAITNPAVVTITGFNITDRVVALPVGNICQKTCTPGSTSEQGLCPTLAVRYYDIVLQGQAKTDSGIKRQMRASVRVRNDQFAGACPL